MVKNSKLKKIEEPIIDKINKALSKLDYFDFKHINSEGLAITVKNLNKYKSCCKYISLLTNSIIVEVDYMFSYTPDIRISENIPIEMFDVKDFRQRHSEDIAKDIFEYAYLNQRHLVVMTIHSAENISLNVY